MSEAAKASQEPSMEEILASIRRIISEDGTDAKEEAPAVKAAPAPAPQPVPPAPVSSAAPEEEEDELVLTDMVVGDSNVVELVDVPEPPMAVAEPPPPPVQAVTAPVEMSPPVQAAPPAVPVKAEPEPMDTELVSPVVAAASASVMAELVGRRQLPAIEAGLQGDGLLVETLVRRAVEPMLKEWLDLHLQDIVERLVRREVERIARRAELG